jgi:hypothetical protein
MGIYVYTLRKNPIVAINERSHKPMAIGVTKYAYKHSSGWDRPEYKRTTSRLHSLAEKARDANPDLTMVVVGDPKEHDFYRYGPMAVYQVKDSMTYFYDSKIPGHVVGYLYKSGKSYMFQEKVDVALAA